MKEQKIVINLRNSLNENKCRFNMKKPLPEISPDKDEKILPPLLID